MRRVRSGWRLRVLAAALLTAAAMVAGAESRDVRASEPPASPPSPSAPTDAAVEQTIRLEAPWSFVTATETGPPEAVLGTIPDLIAAYRWDAAAGKFAIWRAGAPAGPNPLREVAAGDAIWLQLSAPSSWTQPVLTGARTVAVEDGWNTIGWTGPARPALEVLSILGAARIVAFVDGRFESFTLGLPPALNGLRTVERGQALWVQSAGGRSVNIPDASHCDPSYPGVCIPPPPPDLNCDEIELRGFRVVGPDPHGFDLDEDGVGCES